MITPFLTFCKSASRNVERHLQVATSKSKPYTFLLAASASLFNLSSLLITSTNMASNKVAMFLYMSILFLIFCLCSSCVVTNFIVLASIVLCAIVIRAIQTQTWLTSFVANVSTSTYQLLPPSNFASTTSNFNFARATHSRKSSSPIIEQKN